MKNRRLRPFRKVAILLGIVTSGILVACIGPNYASVHFYSDWRGGSKIDYGRVPQEIMVSGWNLESIRDGSVYNVGIPEFVDFEYWSIADEYPKKDTYFENVDQIEAFRHAIHHARNLELHGKYQAAINVFRASSRANRIQSFAQERQELLLIGPNKKGFQEYLKQRYLVEFGGTAAKVNARKAIEALDIDSNLKPFVAYTLAGKAIDKSKAYLAVADQYPHSFRAESALIMAGRALVEYTAEARDDQVAKLIFERLLKQFPQTRFRSNIEGWLGRIELADYHTDKAIAHYIKQSKSKIPHESWKGHQALAEIAVKEGRPANAAIHWLYQRALDDDIHFRYLASKQIREAFGGFSGKDARIVQSKIQRSPELLASYLDFRVEDTNLNPKDERNLLAYISSCLAHLPHVDKSVYARMAQLHYNSGRYSKALNSARRATNVRGEVGQRALYVKAASLARLGRKREAISAYEALYRSSAPKYLHQGCAEPLALLCEETGNYPRAFELYRDIGYHEDAAFIADSVLTPAQLSRLVGKQEPGDKRNILNYTLAMRYFRRGQYEQARSILAKMPVDLRKRKGLNYKEFKDYIGTVYFDDMPKKEIDPLDDVLTLQRLRRQAEHANTQSARATALYKMVQFTHSRRTLMFYSAGLWKGGRADVFGLYWNKKINKGRSDELALKGAMEHEVDAQTVKLCRELVDRCPRSRLVPKALYTAGVSADRLCSLNSWWREQRIPVVNQSIGFFKKLYKRYPHDPLAKDARKFAEEFAFELKPDFDH